MVYFLGSWWTIVKRIKFDDLKDVLHLTRGRAGSAQEFTVLYIPYVHVTNMKTTKWAAPL